MSTTDSGIDSIDFNHLASVDGIEADEETLREQADVLVNEFDLDVDQAERDIVSQNMAETIDREAVMSEAFPVDEFEQFDDIDSGGEWLARDTTLLAKAVYEYEVDHPKLGAKALLIDEYGGKAQLTVFADDIDSVPEIADGNVYELEGGLVSEIFNDRDQVKVTSETEMSLVEEPDVEFDDGYEGGQAAELIGSATVYGDPGHLWRCQVEDEDGETCGRPLNDGKCYEHGDPGDAKERDLRAKVYVHTGGEDEKVLFQREAIEELLGASQEELVERARDVLDLGHIGDLIEEELNGQPVVIVGDRVGEYVLVDEFEVGISMGDPDEVLATLKSNN